VTRFWLTNRDTTSAVIERARGPMIPDGVENQVITLPTVGEILLGVRLKNAASKERFLFTGFNKS
jgi:hypothetical protein